MVCCGRHHQTRASTSLSGRKLAETDTTMHSRYGIDLPSGPFSTRSSISAVGGRGFRELKKSSDKLLSANLYLKAPSPQSKKISNDQELIQSDPISCPQNQKGNN